MKFVQRSFDHKSNSSFNKGALHLCVIYHFYVHFFA